MTTELEKQFFDAFGIEPRKVKICTNTNHCSWKYKLCNDDCKHWKVVRTEYPQITDKHYLELIVLHNIYLETKLYHLEVKSLKEEILQDLIYEQQLREIKKDDVSDNLKHQVQAIFEGER